MRIGYRADQRFWLHVPPAFPTDEFATIVEWEADVTERYSSGRPAATRDELDLVRRNARDAVSRLTSTVTFGLQFWPLQASLCVLLHVEVAPPLSADADLASELLGEVALAIRPEVESVAVAGIGDGISARFIGARTDERGEPEAGIGYILSGPECAVRITSEPTSTTMIGLIDVPLREVVSTMRVLE
ncbi:hypothetical protein [Glaciibacter flavus]|uniref:hypothetical protein n=1 Tax=Orlajensenia flava TaxID=2565934 RepID=UPI003B003511